MLVGIKYTLSSKEKKDPEVPNTEQKKQIKKPVKPEATISTPSSEFVNK